jgi:hypothetical protein
MRLCLLYLCKVIAVTKGMSSDYNLVSLPSNTGLFSHNASQIKLKNSIPAPTFFSLTPNGVYKNGDVLKFCLVFDRIVFTQGEPFLSIGINKKIAEASFVEGSGTMSLIFQYTIQDSDRNEEGISILNVLQSNNSEIFDWDKNLYNFQLEFECPDYLDIKIASDPIFILDPNNFEKTVESFKDTVLVLQNTYIESTLLYEDTVKKAEQASQEHEKKAKEDQKKINDLKIMNKNIENNLKASILNSEEKFNIEKIKNSNFIESLNQRCETLEHELNQGKKRNQRLASQNQQTINKIEEMHTQTIETYSQEIERYTQELETYNQELHENSRLQYQNDLWRVEEIYKAEIEDLKSCVEKFETSMANLRANIEALETRAKALEIKIEILKAEKKKMRDHYESQLANVNTSKDCKSQIQKDQNHPRNDLMKQEDKYKTEKFDDILSIYKQSTKSQLFSFNKF